MSSAAPSLDDYAARLARSTNEKVTELTRANRPRHVLFADQFDRQFLDRVGRTADELRVLSESRKSALDVRDLLSNKRAMLYFTQSSTRTFLSFLAATQVLGMSSAEIRDPSVSSEYKGESPLDSMRMFSGYSDLVVIRDVVPQFAECCAYLMNDIEAAQQRHVPIINGGSGADEHPTQALLDIFTLQRSFGGGSAFDVTLSRRLEDLTRRNPDFTTGLDGKRYAFVGDIGRGRTVRSLCTLLTHFKDVELRFVSPARAHLQLDPNLRSLLLARGAKVSEHSAIDEVLEDSDVIYMTRIQSEHDSSSTDHPTNDELEACRLNDDRVRRMPEHAVIMHPFPRNEEIPSSIDADPRAMYFHQARNGLWIRAALIAHLFDVDTDIREIHDAYTAAHRQYHEIH